MKNLLLSLSAFLIAFSAQAQTLTGRVLDEARNPVPGAAVVLLAWPDSTLVKGEVTDADGRFSLLIPEKGKTANMRLRIQSISMAPRMVPVTGLESDKDFGDMVLPSVTSAMGEVVVQATRPLFEADPEKLTFNVAQSITTQGQTALEVLRKAPGVYVDRNDNITLKGKPGPRIYINGRPSPLNGKDLANYLNSLSSNDIEKIELISNPGARYEAQGAGGIINIRLKENKALGFNGTFNSSFGQGYTTMQYGMYMPRKFVSLNLNYRKGKLGVSGGMNRFDVINISDQRHYRVQRNPDPAKADTVYDPVPSVSISRNIGYNGNVNLDYAFNKRHSVGLNMNAGTNNNQWDTESRTRIVPLYQNEAGEDVVGDTVRVLTASSKTNNVQRNATGGLWYRFQDSSGHILEADVSTSIFSIRQDNYVVNEYLGPHSENTPLLYDVNFQMVMPSTLHLSVAKVDFTTPMAGGTLSTGARFNYVKTDNTFAYLSDRDTTKRVDLLQTDVLRSNQFLYTERVSAGYFTYNTGYKKFKFSAGLRAEHTYTHRDLRTEAVLIERDSLRLSQYLNLFPSGGVTYEIDKKNTLTLNYSRRIDRPNYGQLNPFETKLDELAYQKGNPYLKPQIIDNVELQHTFMGMVNTSLGYSHTSNLFSQIIRVVDGRRNFITNENLASRDLFSLNIATPIQIRKWWTGYTTLNGYIDRYSGRLGGFKDSTIVVPAYSAYVQNTFILGKGWSFEASGYYNSPNLWAGTFRNARFWGIDVGLRRRFLEGRATLGLTVSDIFQTNRWRGVSNYGGTLVDSRGGWDSRVARLTFNYNFGNTKIKANRRKSAIEELNNRAGGGGGAGGR